ncbi:Ribokinase-like protein [Basidiobolus meristosporus CBS 931.73]|uniref:ATP-dependent (S)-NAD(P)H-hydrate dehydratase n=1 Tax=Basidiobolus meristosporus CBS 931.73 TaxID=1314790 RepID=A0A1Y1YD90_9FUNG|nr:Ribokinase-like protein [Basidiobolus meristosporus CBS 931.73]|eukprot:ORX95949.1 Ribokinase-like protein [Basidiobolus meristosporus CBS 931.73]
MSDLQPSMQDIQEIIPPLSSALHKGQAGRVGVVGGSEDYTGAPYFSAISSLKFGADLAHVICELGAGVVIKSYSPDLIVHPYLRKSTKEPELTVDEIVEKVIALYPRLHVLVFGPGLSRDAYMLETTKKLIQVAREKEIPIVIDADGLYLVQKDPDVVKGYRKAILTPNVVEFKRLCEAMGIENSTASKEAMAEELSKAFDGVTVVQKGHEDIISNGKIVYTCSAEGGLKRCGGQGDVLSGAIATFLAFGIAYENRVWKHSSNIPFADIVPIAAYAGCLAVRSCSKKAFDRVQRSMQTSDLIHEIGPVFQEMFEQ